MSCESYQAYARRFLSHAIISFCTQPLADNEIVPARQEVEVSIGGDADEESESMEDAPGGLVGLIASLSGVSIAQTVLICAFN